MKNNSIKKYNQNVTNQKLRPRASPHSIHMNALFVCVYLFGVMSNKLVDRFMSNEFQWLPETEFVLFYSPWRKFSWGKQVHQGKKNI